MFGIFPPCFYRLAIAPIEKAHKLFLIFDTAARLFAQKPVIFFDPLLHMLQSGLELRFHPCPQFELYDYDHHRQVPLDDRKTASRSKSVPQTLPGMITYKWLEVRSQIILMSEKRPVVRYRPPATSMKVPVAYDASSDNSQRIALATSWGVPPRFRGIISARRSTRLGSPPSACISV